MANSRRHDALVALVAIATHATALRSGFIWLDHAHLEDGLALAPPRAWLTLLTRGFAGTGYYRPLMALSLSIDAAIAQRAWLFHLTTVFWHAMAAVLTSRAASSLGLSQRAAVAAGVLFAVHPLSSLVAGTIAFRSEAMAAAALLALIVLHRKRSLAAGAALLLGALVKETALVLGPIFIVALELDARSPRPALRDRARVWMSEGAALTTALGLRLAFAPSWRAAMAPLSPDEAVGTRLAALAKSARRVLLPVDVTVCDAFPVTGLASVSSFLGLGVALGLAYLAYRRRGPALLLALSILPSLQLAPVMRWWSPHYLYVAFAFAAMLIAERVADAGATVQRVAVGAAATLAAFTFNADLRFENDAILWADEVRAEPACREGHFYLAEVARQERRLDDAASSYQRAVATTKGMLSYVDRIPALQNLGVVQLEQGRFGEARAALRSALEIVNDDNDRRRLLHNLATAELRGGNAEEAARLLEVEVARSDAFAASIFIRARAVETLGRTDEARALMRRLQSRMPSPP